MGLFDKLFGKEKSVKNPKDVKKKTDQSPINNTSTTTTNTATSHLDSGQMKHAMRGQDILLEAYFKLASNPDDFRRWDELGDNFSERSINAKARNCYRVAYEKYNEQFGDGQEGRQIFLKFKATHEELSTDSSHNAFLEVLRAMGKSTDPSLLLEQTTSMISKFPNTASLYGAHGSVCLILAGDRLEYQYIDKGVNSYNKAIAIDPSEPTYYINMANLFLIKGDIEKATVLLEKARVIMDSNTKLELSIEPIESLENNYSFTKEDLIAAKKKD